MVRRQPATAARCSVGAPIGWREAATLPLVPADARHAQPHHRRPGVPRGRREVEPTLETNSVLALVAALAAGAVAAVLPGALVRSVADHGGLQARPLVEPVVRTPIGFMTQQGGARHAGAARGAGDRAGPGVAARKPRRTAARCVAPHHLFLESPDARIQFAESAMARHSRASTPNPSPRTRQ